MAGPILSQDAEVLNLSWCYADAVSLAFTVEGADWSGTYQSQIRASAGATGTPLGTLTVVATLNGSDTDFTLSMSQANSALIAPGTYCWDMEHSSRITRLRGSVFISSQVTVYS